MSSIIHIKTNPNLSPKHIEFNRLVKDIEKLRIELSREEQKLEMFSEYYTKNIRPAEVALSKSKMEMAITLDDFAQSSKLPKTIIYELEIIIPELLNEGFEFISPDDATKRIYEKWTNVDLDEVIQEEKEEQLEELEYFMKSMGLDFNVKDIDFDDPESIGEFHNRMEEAKKQKERNEAERQSKRKKTRKQLAVEETEKLQDDIKIKNLRSVYLSLAKILHPDSETDADLKLEKEEIMKQVTKAYEDKDIITLLVIETQWLKNTVERLANIKEDVAAIYIQLLKEQAKKLRQQKSELRYHPRFQYVSSFIGDKVYRGMLRLSLEKERVNKDLRKTQKEIEIIKINPRNEVKKFIKTLAQKYYKDPMDDFMELYTTFRF
ncbi:MAG: hypothetical protein IPP49_11875 [Saprospiraceae bacterium]|nr:hypothetical protein [Saprospiraceae bacterium]